MLSFLKNNDAFSITRFTKCAEVYCESLDNFSIICTFCEIKKFKFEDFLAHFNDEHFDRNPKEIELDWTSETDNSNKENDKSSSNLDLNDVSCKDGVEEYASSPSSLEETTEWDTVAIQTELVEETELHERLENITELTDASNVHVTAFDPVDIEQDYDQQSNDKESSLNSNISNDISKDKAKYVSPAVVFQGPIMCSPTELEIITDFEVIEELSTTAYANTSKLLYMAMDYKQEENENDECDNVEEYNELKILKAHSEKTSMKYVCNVCDRGFDFEKSLKRHIMTFERKIHKCTDCEKHFCDTLALTSHVQDIHKGFTCNQCNKKYKNQKLLRKHVLNKHTGEPIYICDVGNCGKGFQTFVELRCHKRVHNEEQPFVCEICGYRCAFALSLERHKETHSDEKPYTCNTCDRKFGTKSGYYVHLKTHSTEKPFKCDICGKGFRLFYKHKEHYRTHTGEKPYICKICNKGFSSSSGLKDHLPIHSTERLFVCDVCGAEFSHRLSLYYHKYLHLEIKQFKCKFCERVFAQRGGLNMHTKRNHKKNI